jgi:hypothetical protein
MPAVTGELLSLAALAVMDGNALGRPDHRVEVTGIGLAFDLKVSVRRQVLGERDAGKFLRQLAAGLKEVGVTTGSTGIAHGRRLLSHRGLANTRTPFFFFAPLEHGLSSAIDIPVLTRGLRQEHRTAVEYRRSLLFERRGVFFAVHAWLLAVDLCWLKAVEAVSVSMAALAFVPAVRRMLLAAPVARRAGLDGGRNLGVCHGPGVKVKHCADLPLRAQAVPNARR